MLKKLYRKAVIFFTRDIWQEKYPKKKRTIFGFRLLKTFLITLKRFTQNKINQQASSLTLYSLLSIIPIAALVFAVSKGFGIDEQIRLWISGLFPEDANIAEYIFGFAEKSLENTKRGLIAGIGIVFLVWTSLNMFVQTELAFNHIWQINRARSWFNRFTNYISFMLICPILLFLSISITLSIKYFLTSLDSYLPIISIAPIFITGLPYVIAWVLFFALYKTMPNTKVHIIPALVAAIIAGTAFQLMQQFYFFSQVSLSKYNAIYGSFAAIPLFLLCIRIIWLIILFGAELSYAYQNIDRYEIENNIENISHSNIVLISIYILRHISKNFAAGNPSENSEELAKKLSLPTRAVNLIVEMLVEVNLLAEVIDPNDEGDRTFIPAIDIHKITLSYVTIKMKRVGNKIRVKDTTPELRYIVFLLDRIEKRIDAVEGNIKLIDI